MTDELMHRFLVERERRRSRVQRAAEEYARLVNPPGRDHLVAAVLASVIAALPDDAYHGALEMIRRCTESARTEKAHAMSRSR